MRDLFLLKAGPGLMRIAVDQPDQLRLRLGCAVAIDVEDDLLALFHRNPVGVTEDFLLSHLTSLSSL